MSRKATQRQQLTDRLEEALQDLYHNATPNHPTVSDSRYDEYLAWFEDAARCEIDYIQDGGPYSTRELERGDTVARPAGMFTVANKGPREWPYVGSNDYWCYISHYGKLYQYGRGGRTLAPERLMCRSGLDDPRHVNEFSDRSYEDRVEMVQVIESFNRYVKSWNESVPELWAEYVATNIDAEIEQAEAELVAGGFSA